MAGRELKKMLTEALNEYFRPHRTRRKELEQDPAYIRQVLLAGLRQLGKKPSHG